MLFFPGSEPLLHETVLATPLQGHDSAVPRHTLHNRLIISPGETGFCVPVRTSLHYFIKFALKQPTVREAGESTMAFTSTVSFLPVW